MKRNLLYIFLLIIPLLSGCISDDCTDCADMAYDTRVKLKVIWSGNLSTTKSAESPELNINDFTLFVFNEDSTLNTIKKVNNPTFSTTIPYSSSVTMNITSTAKTIYVVANCSDLLSNSPTSSIATQVRDAMANPNPTSLKYLFDNTFAVNYNEIIENTCIVHSGKGNIVSAGEANPYNYIATINIKPIVSKFDIKVSTITGTTPTDYINCIENIDAFVLNSRYKAKLFSIPTIANINSNYIHGSYESFWNPYPYINFQFENVGNTSNTLKGNLTLNNSTPLSIYSPENDTLASLGSGYKTLVVLKVKYKMKTIEGVDEEFTRFLTVPLNPPTDSTTHAPISTLSNKRGTRYTINFTLSGKYFGAMSPLSSLMQPYSPLPYKTTKNLIYVAPEDYSTIKSSVWK